MITIKSTHANFSVNDIDRAKDFYVNKLGLALYKDSQDSIMLKSPAGTIVNIYFKEDHAPWDSTVFGIEVDNLEEALNELATSGIYAEKLPGTDDKGMAHDPDMGDAAWVKDPAGNWLCIGTSD